MVKLRRVRARSARRGALLVGAVAISAAGCTHGGATPVAAPAASNSPRLVIQSPTPAGDAGNAAATHPSRPACSRRGRAVPAGHYTGHIAARLHIGFTIKGDGIDIPDAGEGEDAMRGMVTVTSNGHRVTGSIDLTGLELSSVGRNGQPQAHTEGSGSLKARISGPAGAPRVDATLEGEWHSFDAPVSAGGDESRANIGSLHLTKVGCSAISGNAIEMFRDFLKPVAQYISISGKGNWTARRT